MASRAGDRGCGSRRRPRRTRRDGCRRRPRGRPATREGLERCGLFGDLGRSAERQLEHARPERDTVGSRSCHGERDHALEARPVPELVVAGPECVGPEGLGRGTELGQIVQRIVTWSDRRRAPPVRPCPGRGRVLDEGRQDESDGPEGPGWRHREHNAWYPPVSPERAIRLVARTSGRVASGPGPPHGRMEGCPGLPGPVIPAMGRSEARPVDEPIDNAESGTAVPTGGEAADPVGGAAAAPALTDQARRAPGRPDRAHRAHATGGPGRRRGSRPPVGRRGHRGGRGAAARRLQLVRGRASTLQGGVERILTDRLDWVTEVLGGVDESVDPLMSGAMGRGGEYHELLIRTGVGTDLCRTIGRSWVPTPRP